MNNFYVPFINTFTGLGKSTFFELLKTKYSSFYETYKSDLLDRNTFNKALQTTKKIGLADKNFPRSRDIQNLSRYIRKQPIILFANNSFSFCSIILVLNRILKRTDHETLFVDTEEQRITTLKVTLSFIKTSSDSLEGGNQPKEEHIKVEFYKNDIISADSGTLFKGS